MSLHKSPTAVQPDSHRTDATHTSVSQATDNTDARTDSAGIVIIGAGMAGSRFAIELARARQQSMQPDNANAPLPITLISKELHVGYNRIMLSPVLAGDTTFDDTYLYNKSDYEQLGITVLAGVNVDTIDTEQQCIELDNRQTLHYAKVVIATGSTARVIPFPNHTAKGVHVFRDSTDVVTLTEYARQGKTGLVIGGGVLGLEAACALAGQGANMTVIHVDGYVLNAQLDLPAAELLQAELARRGVGLEVSANTESIAMNDAGEVCGLSLKDGRTLPADFIVMAVGVIPNTVLAKDSGLEVNRGIVVDNCMHTSCRHVYAIGECVELDGELFGMVAPVNQQVDTLVTVLKDTVISDPDATSDDIASEDNAPSQEHWRPFVSKPLSLKLKVSGVAAFSAGQIAFDDSDAEHIETLVYRQPTLNHYHCLYLRDNKVVGAVLYGEVNDGSFYNQLIMDDVDITPIKEALIFGEAYCDLDKLNPSNMANDEVDVVSDTDNNNADSNDKTKSKAADLVEEAS